MTDKEIYKLIEEYKDDADAFYERTHEQVEASIVKHAQTKRRRKKILSRVLSVAVAAVLIISLAITLPIVLKGETGDGVIRYNDDSLFTAEKLDTNLKEYSRINNLSLLYLDWYEYAEDLLTRRYYEEGKESDTVYLHESFTDEWYTGAQIQLTVMKRTIVVDSFDERLEGCETTNTGNTQVSYILRRTFSLARFEYQGYKYYLEISDQIDLNFLTDTIESMFNN